MIRNAFWGLVLACAVIFVILACLGFRPGDIAAMLAHPIRGGTGPVAVTTPPAAPAPGPEAAIAPKPFGAVNSAVLGIYLLAMLAIGAVTSRRTTNTREFFMASGRLHYVVVGISILATYLSALTMMGLSGMAFGQHDWIYTVQLPFLVVTAAVITGFVLPRYREAGIISIYEYLEQKIHVSARLIASVSFIVFAVGRMGLLLYLPALAFCTATGISLPLCIIVIGVVTTVYTVMGGMEAVIWNDLIQTIVFTAGALFTLGFIFHSVGVPQFLAVGMECNKFRVVGPSLNLTKITTLWLILETLYQTIRIYGTQQDMAQRYMTPDSTEKANRSVWVGILSYIPLGFVFYFTGTALFVFYHLHPELPVPAKADSIYPHFAVHHMPPGGAGLIIAAIFAAAMSSIDSAMNSASTVCLEDFIRRFRKTQKPDREDLRLARLLTVAWGILAILMGLALMDIEYAQIVWGKVMAITTNGILGLMALAFLPFRVKPWAAAAGFIVSTICLCVLVLGSSVNFLLWPVIGNSVCFLVALLAHGVLREPAGSPPRTP